MTELKRKTKRVSPTQRSLALLRKMGYTAGITEKWNSFIKVRQDLFGFVDLVAIRPCDQGTLFVQTTTRAHVNERIAKMMAIPALTVACQSRNHVHIHGWSKKGKRGARKMWECSVTKLVWNPLTEKVESCPHSYNLPEVEQMPALFEEQ